MPCLALVVGQGPWNSLPYPKSYLIELYVLFHFSVVCRAVDITHFRVPKFVNRKDEVSLECDFRMSEPHETLHSVKWYRIDHSGSMEDFFTYSPAKNPPVKTYPRTGIKVDVS